RGRACATEGGWGGAVCPARNGGSIRARVELTLHFKPVDVASLFLPGAKDDVALKRTIKVDPENSRLRVFVAEKWNEWRHRAGRDAELDKLVEYSASLSGALTFLHREASTYRQRRCRAIRAWVSNRRLRAGWQAAVKMIEDWRAGIKMKPLPPGAGNWTLCRRLPILKDKCRRVAQ